MLALSHFIVMAFPPPPKKKQRFWDDFPLCPQCPPLKKRKFYFDSRLAVSETSQVAMLQMLFQRVIHKARRKMSFARHLCQPKYLYVFGGIFVVLHLRSTRSSCWSLQPDFKFSLCNAQ